ncbi:MAG: LysR family transcriptional regulator [Flavobacteriaceae bacterium]|nr:LysR family transcriptional regulator [Flavobacteriaceae bacterium]
MKYHVKSKIWIELNDQILLGEGRVKLLKEIEINNSLSKAAKEMNMSYKKAWRLIDEINTVAPEKVVESNIGGKNGGGSQITKYGKSLIKQYEQLKMEQIKFADLKSEEFKP